MKNRENGQIWYEDVVALGFSIEVSHDGVREKQYGNPDWIVAELRLTKRDIITWDQDDLTCDLLRLNKSHSILYRHRLRDLAELRRIVELFSEPSDINDFHLAC